MLNICSKLKIYEVSVVPKYKKMLFRSCLYLLPQTAFMLLENIMLHFVFFDLWEELNIFRTWPFQLFFERASRLLYLFMNACALHLSTSFLDRLFPFFTRFSITDEQITMKSNFSAMAAASFLLPPRCAKCSPQAIFQTRLIEIILFSPCHFTFFVQCSRWGGKWRKNLLMPHTFTCMQMINRDMLDMNMETKH